MWLSKFVLSSILKTIPNPSPNLSKALNLRLYAQRIDTYLNLDDLRVTSKFN